MSLSEKSIPFVDTFVSVSSPRGAIALDHCVAAEKTNQKIFRKIKMIAITITIRSKNKFQYFQDRKYIRT